MSVIHIFFFLSLFLHLVGFSVALLPPGGSSNETTQLAEGLSGHLRVAFIIEPHHPNSALK